MTQSAKTNTPLCVPGDTATQGRCAASPTDSSKWLARCSQTNRFLITITQDMNSPYSIQLKLDCGVIAPQKLLTNGRKSFYHFPKLPESSQPAPVVLRTNTQLEHHAQHCIATQTSFPLLGGMADGCKHRFNRIGCSERLLVCR